MSDTYMQFTEKVVPHMSFNHGYLVVERDGVGRLVDGVLIEVTPAERAKVKIGPSLGNGLATMQMDADGMRKLAVALNQVADYMDVVVSQPEPDYDFPVGSRVLVDGGFEGRVTGIFGSRRQVKFTGHVEKFETTRLEELDDE